MLLPLSCFLILACERNDYDLLAPETAGTWTLYTTADGLPSNNVGDIKLDSRDNLWISFPGYGIARYDNKSWTYFRTSTSLLINDNVNCLETSADGRILFGTLDGLSILVSGYDWSSYKDPVDVMDITSIKVASNGWIWVGTRSMGFYVNSGSGYVKNVLTGYENVRAIEEGISGAIYIGTNNGLVRWHNNNYSYVKKADGLPDNNITSLRFDSRQRLWVGTEVGRDVAWLDNNGTIHKVNLMTGTDSLRIRDIFEDRRGHIWFATNKNGLIRYDGVVPYTFKEYNGFPENKVNCIGQDKYGNLWFGLHSRGLVKYILPID
ncbi:MAG: ligand-binding sensor domain-containing protein [Bacteroidales bacterium]